MAGSNEVDGPVFEVGYLTCWMPLTRLQSGPASLHHLRILLVFISVYLAGGIKSV